MRDALQEFMTFNRPYAQRSAELMRLKIARMVESAFAYFRGTFHLFSRDVLDHSMIPLPLLTSDGGAEMELVGDIHSENSGTYKAADGLIHYDINDFDESMFGRFDFDVCRFAVNVVLASQEREHPLETQTAAVMAALTSYLDTVRACFKNGEFLNFDVSEKKVTNCEPVAQLVRQQTLVKRPDFIAETTEKHGDKRQIKRAMAKYFNLSDAEKSQAVRLLEDFRKRWKGAPDKRNFFDFHDAAGRISGIGSMGRFRYVVLVSGKGAEGLHHVLLEFKEARPAAYDTYRKRTTTAQDLLERAEKVTAAARAGQAASSPYLGHAIDGAMSFQVREISPHAEGVKLKHLKPAQFIDLMKLQAAILARVHVRASTRYQGPTNPLPELADTDRFRQRVLAFALGYADVAFRDWERFKAARGDLENVAQWAT